MKPTLTIIVLFLVVMLYGCSAQCSGRKDCGPAFESNFGFKPPSSIEELRLTNFNFRDVLAQWMMFTYDPDVFARIINHDSPLNEANIGTSKHEKIIEEFSQDSPNCPSWFMSPNSYTEKIYYKNDFLDHTFSEYYLWVDYDSEIVYLHVHYFD